MKHLFRSVGTRRILPVCGSVAGPLEEVPRACLLLQEGMRHRWQWGSPLANVLSPQEVISCRKDSVWVQGCLGQEP